MRLVLLGRTCGGNQRVYRVESDQPYGDPMSYFEDAAEVLMPYLQRVQATMPFKLQFCLRVGMEKIDGTESRPHFNTKLEVVLKEDDLVDVVSNLMATVTEKMEKFQEMGSGWMVYTIEYLDMTIGKYSPPGGSSYVKLDQYLESKKALLNIQNNDDKCFLWTALAALHPVVIKEPDRPNPGEYRVSRNPQRVSHYTPFENELDMTGIQYPVRIKDIPRFETQNNISVYVYGHDEGQKRISPLYYSKNDYAKVIKMVLYKGHYTLVRNFNGLLADKRQHHCVKWCPACLFPFYDEVKRDEHFTRCRRNEPTKIILPQNGDNYMKFKNPQRALEAPLMIYADFECLTEKVERAVENDMSASYTQTYQKHVPCGYAILPVRRSAAGPEYLPSSVYRGEDAVPDFLRTVVTLADDHHNNISKPLDMTKSDWVNYNSAPECCICKKPVGNDRVRDHCHVSGKFRGPAHPQCNLEYKLTKDVTVGFHNLRRYDGHLIMQRMAELCEEMNDIELEVVPKSVDDFLSFSVKVFKQKRKADGTPFKSFYRIRFIDTCQFLLSGLDTLVANLEDADFKAMKERFNPTEMEVLTRKLTYPYDYMDDWPRFEETTLPKKDDYFNILTDSDISDDEYDQAQKVFEILKCRNLGELHDLYVETDVRLLSDVFEQFRDAALKNYGLDPVHYITLPSFAFDAMLKYTGVELELLTDPDMYMFFEDSMRGGISVIGCRRGDANNKDVPETYDQRKKMYYLMYLDVNNLYGKAMCESLPKNGFRWMTEEELKELDITSIGSDGRGCMLEVDLEYPEYLHDEHNAYPLAPEHVEITEDMLSDYARRMKTTTTNSMKKLAPNLRNKTKYIVHYKNLQLYLKHGMKLTKIYRGVSFNESPWMEPYIMFNTAMRKKATSDSDKNFFKLANNAVFGKTMENVRRYQDVRFASDPKKQEKLFSSPRLRQLKIYGDRLSAYNLLKKETVLGKPIAVGSTILDISKTYMYQFHYEYMLPTYGWEKVNVHMTDTDSFIYGIETEDLYGDFAKEMDRFDFSDYPVDHPMYSEANKKVLGKMKDETSGIPIMQFAGTRSKSYSLLLKNLVGVKRNKGVGKNTLRKAITHQDYVKTLEEGLTMRHVMRNIQRDGHQIVSREQNKVSLCAYDDKRFLLDDGITSYAYGHFRITDL